MALKLGHEDEALVEINVVPLVDIVLVLLIIFMVTATFIVKPAIDMELPKADTGESKERNQFSLILGKDGSIGIGDTVFKSEQEAMTEMKRLYDEYINTTKDQNREFTMIIQADTLISHGRVIHFIDEARKIGILKYAFNVDPEAAAQAPVASPDAAQENTAPPSPAAPPPGPGR